MKAILISLTLLATCLTFFSCSDDEGEIPQTLVSYTETIRPGATEGQDAFIYTFEPDRNLGEHPDFMVTKFSSVTVRNLIRFDFSNIPSGAIVDSAKISLYSYQSASNGTHNSGSGASYLQRLEDDWTEDTVTWNNQPTSTEDDRAILEAAQSTIQDYLDIDVTEMTKVMVSDPSENHGFILQLQDETIGGKLVFGSSDNTNADLHPQIVVYYSVFE